MVGQTRFPHLSRFTIGLPARQYGTGALAFFDTIASGLVPVKVTAVTRDATTRSITITAVVTAARGAYRRGHVVNGSPTFMVPRSYVYRPRGAFFPRLRGGYEWIPDAEASASAQS